MDTLVYHLAENMLTADPLDYMAQVEVKKSYTFEDVVEEMLKRGTLTTRTDIVAVLNLFHQVTADVVADGYAINLPLCNGSPSISGVFNGPGDAFDPNRHLVRYNLTPGTLVRDAAQKIRTEKTDPIDNAPYIGQYFDTVSQSSNDSITPGGIGELQGSRIGFDASDPEQGIFFVDSNGAEYKVETVAYNKPSKLIFMVPALPQGDYEVMLRVKFRNTKSLRKSVLRKSLVVAGQTT